jgi:Ca2+-binding EF-hand superfamily protein
MRWTIALAALALTTAAQAGDPTSGAAPRDPAADTNGDGFVTREEALSYPRLAEHFDAADANKDGRLDAAEMDAHRQAVRADGRAKAQARWQAADKDGDGAISREEAEASMPGVAERFKKFDVDGNGKIEREELHHFRMRKKDRAAPSE